MLSIEKLAAADPSQISLLKSSSSDERPPPSSSSSSDSDKKQLDLNHFHDNKPLPKFSLRDYVFRSRRKDIKTNWPFSQKNLQLCLKHGVTDFLPPFQSVKGCAVDNCSIDKDKTFDQEEHVKVDDDPRCMSKLAADHRNISASRSDKEKVIRSTITSHSCSEIDSDPTAERNPSLETEAVGKSEGKGLLPPMSNKSGSTAQPPAAKKCRLIVKLGNATDHGTVEEETTTSNNFMASEAMASKVCPVCKTFTSSSNTTLNAHIDQCLSGESTIKWTENSNKVIKHRIKPRKTRLMVDIYTTAACCTLEDLDRRNGTNWASNPSLCVRDTEVSAVEKLDKPPPVSHECTDNEGAVYIDANGTKVRILSKFSDEQPQSSKLINDPLQKNLVDGDKRSKFILTNKRKKKNHTQRQHKLLKSSRTKKFCLSKPYHCPKIEGGQDSTFSPRENVVKEDCLNAQLRSPEQVVLNGLGTIKQWACSKRTGLTRKISDKGNHQRSGGVMLTAVQDGNDVLPMTGSSLKIRSSLYKSPRSSVNTVCLPESSQRKGDVLLEPQDEHSEEPSLQKKVDFSLSRSQFPSNKKRSLVLQRNKEKHLKVDVHSVNNGSGDRPKITVDHALSVKNMRVGRNSDLLEKADNSEINGEPSTSHPAFSSKARKLASLRKNLLSVSEGPARGVKCSLKWKTASPRKSSMRCTSESEEAVVCQTEGEKRCIRGDPSETKVQVSKSCDRVIVKRSRTLSIGENREGVMVSYVEGTLGLKSCSQSSAEIHSDNETGSTLAGASDAMRSVKVNDQTQNDKTMDPAVASEFAARGDFTSFSKSLDAGSDEFQHFSRCTKAATRSQDPILGVEEEMFSAAEIGKSMSDHNLHDDVTELGCNDGQGNYFLEVDPIPIPGPPGSFLPSPGRMSSDDLHGSSSLTSSKIQSSADYPEFFDQDSSGSPTSAASTVSNSTMARTGSRYSDKLSGNGRDSSESLKCHTAGWEDKRSSFSGSSTVDLLVENSVTRLQTANTGDDRDGLDKFNANTFFPGKGAFRFTNDKPCCCVRKDGASQESQLLQRRATAPSPFPASENQLRCDSIRRPNNISNSFSLSDSSSGPETNATKSSIGYTQFGVSADSDFKLPTRDSESFSPSASNPVLRLMGKDLMVVNKDEDSPLKRSSHSNSMNDLANTRLADVSCGSLRSEDLYSSRQVDAHNRLVSHLPQTGDPVQHFDVRLLNGFKSRDSYSRPQQLSPTSPVSISCKSSGSGLMGSVGRQDYLGGCNLHTVLNGPNDETCDGKKFVATPASHWQNSTSVGNAVKEIIIIDDSPENGADSAYTMGTGRSKSSTGIQMQMISSGYTSKFVNFCENRPCGSPYSGSGVAQNANLPTQMNEIPAKWNGNPEGCSFVRPSSFSASSSPAGPFRSSSLYYSAGFS
ncbi:uncharacterized protein [Nicotiana sylvestris]|uniref:Uncharacterized protein n=2 Tax=Nicotiana TaxID=4085 RepID=A0A1S4B9Z0_TOBAC|nr:PREDICTED: uncharacterized protein LOC104241199 [Nicotiana sylvestris]XP_009794420.1 PREDICTED: uncharacterized protein LOC104241199 [Nicotiana sylvestris]XP_009794421.1 PREDICTED: uncharacterized protein LOC104241199 [Nicotiana sylvestris]XP_016485682.1 PREDICTED: uncharacterized protein LOC107806080 [Nicotiana tabacum]XP_016485683.1 PREDICTED: uncharacterized protein LOC107806080 [Nicotiana tabacum]XP_016485684.1 PREDICTED: uncharacterized protein LOC107806080 [Nicotiana tabacum]